MPAPAAQPEREREAAAAAARGRRSTPGSGTVVMQPIVIDTTQGSMVIVKSGLEANQQVVVDGADKLQNGSKVSTTAVPIAARSSSSSNWVRRESVSHLYPAARGHLTPDGGHSARGLCRLPAVARLRAA